MEWTTALGISMIVAVSAFLLIAGVSHLAAKKYRRPQPAPSPRKIRVDGPITLKTERGTVELRGDRLWLLQDDVAVAEVPIAQRNVRQESDTSFFNWPELSIEVSSSFLHSPSAGSFSGSGASYDSGSSSSDSGSSGGWD